MSLRGSPPARRSAPAGAGWVFLWAAGAFLVLHGLCGRGFTDNEGMYAEIGREVLLRADWVTTHLNGEVYLNKPPLMFWLIALVLRLGGMNELPRLICGVSTLLTFFVVYQLGSRLRNPSAGAWAAAAYLTALFTPLEARVLRPDPLLTLLICTGLWGAVVVYAGELQERFRGRLAFWLSVGLAMMVKGLLGLLLPLMALLPALLLARRWRDWRLLAPWWGPVLVAAIVLPWHIAAGIRNQGFWWDYVVNQHLLFFFDRKFPRDSVPQPLWYVWAVFAGRLMPWTFFIPAAVAAQLREARRSGTVAAWLPLTWLGMICLFFSLAKSRLDHYLIPAVPAGALLVGALIDAWVTAVRHNDSGTSGSTPASVRGACVYMLAASSLLGLLGIAGFFIIPGVLRGTGTLDWAPGMLAPSISTMVTVAIVGVAAALLAARRRLDRAFGALAAGFLVFGFFSTAAMDAAAEITSPRSLVRRIPPDLLAESEVAYEAGQEYQLCGSLNFYLGRRLTLLKPPGFVPPTYLRQDFSHLFVDREPFRREWQTGARRIFLITDPDLAVDRNADYPQPFYEADRAAGRQLLTNLPLPGSTQAPGTRPTRKLMP